MVAEPRWTNFVASCRSRLVSPSSASSSESRTALFCSAAMTVPSFGATLKRYAAAALLPAPAMLVTTIAGLPGMCLGMCRARSRAGRRADDHGDLLAPVELRGGLLGARRLGRQRGDDHNACETVPHSKIIYRNQR